MSKCCSNDFVVVVVGYPLFIIRVRKISLIIFF